MDISKIDATKVGTDFGFKIGNEDAPVKVIEFINLSCPFCKMWHDLSTETLDHYVAAGKIQRIIKHFDKEKPSLQKGNVAHHHLDYSNPEKALENMNFLFQHQSAWKELTNEEVAEYIEKTVDLKNQPNQEQINGIIAEAEASGIFFVPTVIIGKHIFDEHITPEELVTILDSELAH
ncbi:thioredoxin domain-containing protein [Carnobacterium gallinarum]|uniref:thioredoxin domain-containing protein n=1 Tax=Carnobacterium gallinarum TaxID=2749 RepID=UPI0005563979|nr:thioredoxin domain-containing protein [Carnobacterium gallinarum]